MIRVRRVYLARALASGVGRRRWATKGVVFQTRRPGLARLAEWLDTSCKPERRALGAMLRASLEAGDGASAAAIASTAICEPDLRAEKVLSHRHRFVWLCNPKVASRSIIAGLRAADPHCELIEERTFEEIVAARPEVARYTSFAFVRHPGTRIASFWNDKHALARRDRTARRTFIDPWHGLSVGMSLDALCRWLDTPCGSDAFADRHWLSQHVQLRTVEGRLPDLLGAFERLDKDWRALCARLGLKFRALPRLNATWGAPEMFDALDAPVRTLIERRYADDFALGDY